MGTTRARDAVNSALALVAIVGGTFLIAFVGAVFAGPEFAPWYTDAAQPSWASSEPMLLSATVAVHTAAAVAVWLAWRNRLENSERAVTLTFALALASAATWSACTFALATAIGTPAQWLGLLAIAVTLALSVRVALLLHRRGRLMMWLFIPYAAWTVYLASISIHLLASR